MRIFFASFAIIFSLLFTPLMVHGQSLKDSVNTQLQAGGKKSGLTTDGAAKDPRAIVAGVIEIVLSLIGMICIALVVTAGYWYLTSHGETDKIDKAKHTLAAAVVGLAITMSAYAITAFVAMRIQNEVQQKPVYDLKEKSFPPGGGSKTYDIKDINLDTWTK